MDVATSTPAAETAEVEYEPWVRKRTCPTPLKTSSVQKKKQSNFFELWKKRKMRDQRLSFAATTYILVTGTKKKHAK